MLTDLQYRVLRRMSPSGPSCCTGAAYEGGSKVEVLLGTELLRNISGKTVIDFGCGEGVEAIELARSGAKRVIGLDIREDVLEIAKRRAASACLEDICVFSSSTDESADTIVSIDAFEHFADPAEILRIMSTLLKPGGEVLVSFGPPWYHPLGGHLFSVFPWAHLIFSEEALLRWRATFKIDGATRFGEVAGGLNQMTIQRFEQLVETSAFRLASLELLPIRKFRAIHNRLTREFTTAVVRSRLVIRTE